ncbi:hypothetical protein [Fontivita pretiosa]|uniref:hypothetical protein n=1 Tax=Fontivita pretiosa TaxID=2989684 RepID=UPI003D173175
MSKRPISLEYLPPLQDPFRDVDCTFRIELDPPQRWSQVVQIVIGLLAAGGASALGIHYVARWIWRWPWMFVVGLVAALLFCAGMSAALVRELIRSLQQQKLSRIVVAVQQDKLFIYHPLMSEPDSTIRSWNSSQIHVSIHTIGLSLTLRRLLELRIRPRADLPSLPGLKGTIAVKSARIRFLAPRGVSAHALESMLQQHLKST